MATNKLASALADVRKRIARAGAKGLNEQNTKATLIEPVLRALGWDTEDVEEVVREYRIKTRDKPVDYGLLVLREAKLFVEAKGLGEDLDDRRWTNQIMGYAGVAGVEWIVLTDGNEYRIFNTHASVPVDEKLFRTVRVTDEAPVVADTLALLAKDQLDANRIEALWKAQFIDRRVRHALEALFSGESDMVLVNNVIARTKNLSTDDVRASIRRCKFTLDFPVNDNAIDVPVVVTPPKKGSRVALANVIRAGVLIPPVHLFRKYKGQTLSAEVHKDGSVTSAGKTCSSLSIAGNVARAAAGSRRPDGSMHTTNGWTFWKYKTSDGVEHEVDHARRLYLRKKPAPATKIGAPVSA